MTSESYLLFAETQAPAPSHAIREVRTGFCNLHDSLVIAPSTQGRPIFSPYFPCLPTDEQDEWIRLWKTARFTHVVVMTTNPIYPEGLPQYGGAFYPAPSFDPTAAQFAGALSKLIVHGFTPIVFCTNGAFPDDWGAFVAMLQAYVVPFKNQIIAVEGWEPYWTNDQHRQVYAALRSLLGPDAVLGLHLPWNYIHNGNGPGDWNDAWPEVDVFLFQGEPYGAAANLPAVTPGWQQNLVRVCPPGTIAGPSGPYYLAGHARPVTICLFETNAFFQIRDWATDADMDAATIWGHANGVQYFGNATRF